MWEINLMLPILLLCVKGDPLIGLLLKTLSNRYDDDNDADDDDNNNNKIILCRWERAFSYKAGYLYMIRMLHLIQSYIHVTL
jgi:hypothetical protein